MDDNFGLVFDKAKYMVVKKLPEQFHDKKFVLGLEA